MERRDWSLKALEELNRVDSLDDEEKAQGIKRWALKYLNTTDVTDFDLETKELLRLQELLYKNTDFLIQHTKEIQGDLKEINHLKKFLQN